MRLMIPFVPHIANECLELLNCKNKVNGQKSKDLQMRLNLLYK